MPYVTVLALALSSSIDNFGVGISYGVRGIRISTFSNLVISLIAFIFSEAGIRFGQQLAKLFPGMWSSVIGAAFLSVLGLRIILLMRREKQPDNVSNKQNFGLQGNTRFIETVTLGMAISMNAMGNGLGAGVMGLSPLAISATAAMFSFVSIWTGVVLGRKLIKFRIGSWTLGQFSTVISGILLLFIAAKSLL